MDPEIIQGLMCIFFLRHVLKAIGNGPIVHSRTYVYIPPYICIESFRKQTKRSFDDLCVYSSLERYEKLMEQTTILIREGTKLCKKRVAHGARTPKGGQTMEAFCMDHIPLSYIYIYIYIYTHTYIYIYYIYTQPGVKRNPMKPLKVHCHNPLDPIYIHIERHSSSLKLKPSWPRGPDGAPAKFSLALPKFSMDLFCF